MAFLFAIFGGAVISKWVFPKKMVMLKYIMGKDVQINDCENETSHLLEQFD